jgi:hypothetical protein
MDTVTRGGKYSMGAWEETRCHSGNFDEVVIVRNPVAFVIANCNPCEAIPVSIKAIITLTQSYAVQRLSGYTKVTEDTGKDYKHE